MVQRIAVGRAHVVHADRRDSPHARVDLGRANDEAAAATAAEHANTLPVHGRLGPQVVHRCAKSFGIDFRCNGVSRQALALAPERLIDRQGDEALFGQLLRIQVPVSYTHLDVYKRQGSLGHTDPRDQRPEQ